MPKTLLSHRILVEKAMEFKDAATLIGAIVGAVTASANLWLSLRSKSDKIKVNYGPINPPIAPGHSMYVVSRCDHRVSLVDYGFVLKSRKLQSLRQLWTEEPGDENERVLISGQSTLEERGDIFSIEYQELRDEVIGAYAITASDDRISLGFRAGLSLQYRIILRLSLKFFRKMA